MAKRGNGEGSIGQYRGRWVARVTDAEGRRKQLYGATRKEVAKKLADAIRDRDGGLPTLNDKVTLGDFLLNWLEKSVKMRNRPSTVRSYTGHIQVHLLPALGKKRLARLTPEDVEGFMQERLTAGLSPATVIRIRSTLRRALAIAQKQGLVIRNVAALADPPSLKGKHFKVWTAEQAREFLSFVHGHRMEALFVVAISTGLRQGELLGLTWDDIDLDKRQLTVRRAVQRVDGELVMVEPKTTQSRRTLSVPQIAVVGLQEEARWQEEMRKASAGPWNPMGLVFPSRNGTPLDGGNVTRSFQKLLGDAGLPRIRFHDLRHTCASLLLAQGEHMRVIMEQLGHSQIGLTMNTYSHVMHEALEGAADKLERALSPGGAAA
jgi:integrase